MITEIGIRKNSVLDVLVSCYAHAKETKSPQNINLINWLTSLKYKDKVDAIRAEPDEVKQKVMKKKMPLITVSGTFTQRKDKCLIEHSGLICIDIDKQDNLHLENFDDLGPILKEIPHAAYVGRSVRGEGFMVFFAIKKPALHRVYYRAIEEQFAVFGINIDEGCINESRARFYSYDEDGQMRHQPILYNRLPKPIPSPPPKIKRVRSNNYTGNGKRIPNEVIDELQSRVSLTDIVSYFSGSTTTKTGAGSSLKMQCPCPDTRVGSDRFTVWPADNTFFCHKCDKGKGLAGPFKLLEEFNGMDFREAAHFMAETFCADLLRYFTDSAQLAQLPPLPAQSDEPEQYHVNTVPPPASLIPEVEKEDRSLSLPALLPTSPEPAQRTLSPFPSLPEGWGYCIHTRELVSSDGVVVKGWFSFDNWLELTDAEAKYLDHYLFPSEAANRAARADAEQLLRSEKVPTNGETILDPTSLEAQSKKEQRTEKKCTNCPPLPLGLFAA